MVHTFLLLKDNFHINLNMFCTLFLTIFPSAMKREKCWTDDFSQIQFVLLKEIFSWLSDRTIIRKTYQNSKKIHGAHRRPSHFDLQVVKISSLVTMGLAGSFIANCSPQACASTSRILKSESQHRPRNCCSSWEIKLTNWRQFFMRLSCYWSWILSSHCQSSCGSADYFDNVMTKFMINNRTDTIKNDINLFFTITNCRIAGSRLLTRRMNFKFMCLSAYWQWKLADECA